MMDKDFTTAFHALAAARYSIAHSPEVTECTIDGDNDSAEIIFKAGKTWYVLKLKELEDVDED